MEFDIKPAMVDHMIMKVEVVSRETIKPSCPTPPLLTSFNLSFLDQLAPSLYIPLVLFYTFDGNNKDDSNVIIKKSLVEQLTRFYPFAGRIKDNRFVDCNDDGVDYFEAKVSNCRLSHVIQHVDVHELVKQFLPFDPFGSEISESSGLIAVQVNYFEECNGMVIGLCFYHKIADASTLTTFINDWAATARGATEQVQGPNFELSSFFPPRDELMGFVPPLIIRREEEIVTKNFVFEASKIAELKKKSFVANGSHDPTRVEALTAFIWRCFIDVDQAKEEDKGDDSITVYGALHSVNMRTRMVPPLPPNTFGNMFSTATAILSSINNNADDEQGEKLFDQDQYSKLVGKIRDAMKKIDNDHVRKLQITEEHLNSMKQIDEEGISSAKTMILSFSSWCRLPIYEANFGWGKPIWVSTCTFPFKNLVWLMDTSSGDGGIEAWLHMTKEDMAEFERRLKQLME